MPWRRAGLCSGIGRRWHRISTSLADGAREVSLKVEQHFRDTRMMPTMTEAFGRPPRPPVAPQTGCSGLSHSVSVFCRSAVFASHPLSQRNCRCGRPLDVFGHHFSACNSRCWVGGASPWRAWWLAYAGRCPSDHLHVRHREIPEGMEVFEVNWILWTSRVVGRVSLRVVDIAADALRLTRLDL